MKVLVTGANGFVGTNLRRFLASHGHVCATLDLADADYGWDDLGRIPFETFDAVVHLAGKAHDLKKVASEQSYFDVNVGLTERIFAACAAQRLTFVYFSSSKASPEGNAYGRSKFAAEEFLKSAAGRPRVVILRPAMIHGPGNKGNLNLLWKVARQGFPWPLAAFENRRSFTSVGNVCAVVEAIASGGISRPADDGRPSAYFVADDEPVSTNRIIGLMAEASGRRARLWRLPKGLMRLAARIGDVLHLPLTTERLEKLTEDCIVDNYELKKALGWTAMPVRAEDGLRETLKNL